MTCKDCIHFDACASFWYSDYDCVANVEDSKQKHGIDEACELFKPAADVVEVVRCRDCIYYKANSCFNRQWDFESSTEIPLVRDCDFCSYGERKNDGK